MYVCGHITKEHESKTICLVLMAMALALIYRQFGMIVIVTLTKLMNPVVTVCWRE